MSEQEFDKRVKKFATALWDLYVDEEEREGAETPKIELREENLTDDFTAMIMAVHLLYISITGDDEVDLIGFTHMVNRLVFQWYMKNQERESEDNSRE